MFGLLKIVIVYLISMNIKAFAQKGKVTSDVKTVLVFDAYNFSDKNIDYDIQLKSFFNENKQRFGLDTASFLEYKDVIEKVLQTYQSTVSESQDYETFTITFYKDRIWKRREYRNTVFKDTTIHRILYSFDYDKLPIYIHNNTDTTIIEREIDNAKDLSYFRIIKDFSKRKQILGYDCYYVKIIEKEKIEDGELSFGNHNIEMYVTDSIKLPIHTVIFSGILIKDYFPLEVKITDDKLRDCMIYKANRIFNY